MALPTVELRLDEEAVKKLMGGDMHLAISGAILQQLGPEGRDELMKKALEAMIVPYKRYDTERPRSPIERLFEDTYTEVAKVLVKEEMEQQDSRLRTEIKTLLDAVIERVFSDPKKRESLTEELSAKFIAFLNRETRGY